VNKIITMKGSVQEEADVQKADDSIHCAVCDGATFYPLCKLKRTRSRYYADLIMSLHCTNCNTKLPGVGRGHWNLPKR